MTTSIKGRAFEKYIEDKLKIRTDTNKNNQLMGKESESLLGLEMKSNEKADYMGCYIEIWEKSNKYEERWRWSKWIISSYINFMICGNKEMFWILEASKLRVEALKKLEISTVEESEIIEIDAGTSAGFTINKKDLDKLCIVKFDKKKGSGLINLKSERLIKEIKKYEI